MAERLIGEAYISILPDSTLFRTKASSEINAALAGLRPSVKITGDTKDVDAKVAALAAALKGLNGQANIELNTKEAIRDIAGLEAAIVGLWDRLDNIPVDLDDSRGLAKLYGLIAGSEDLAKKLEDLGDADFDINKALAKFYSLEAGAKALEAKISNLDANVNDAAANAKLIELGNGVKVLSDRLDNMRADVNDAQMLAKIVTMQAAALKLARTLNDMPVTADILPAEASLFKLAAQVEALQAKMRDMTVGVATTLPVKPGSYSTLGITGLSPGEAQMMDELTMKTLDAMTAFQKLNKVEEDNSTLSSLVSAGLAKIAATDSMIVASDAGGWWGALNTHVRLFGGALDSILPKMLTSVSVWHIAADAILEFAAAWGPALIAVGTFAAYAYPVGEKIYDQWKNINTILDGVGGKLPDLGTSFDTIERAIEPSVLEAFGEYMMVIGKNAQPLGDALAKVGQVVDVWGAKMVGWASSAQKSFDSIVSIGAKDFAEIGYGFEQVFRIIGDLIKDLPGYVHYLLLIGDAILTMAADAVQAAAPLIKVGLALHGFMIYVGLAVTAVVALGRALAAGALTSFAATTGTELTAAGTAAEVGASKFSKFGLAIGAFAGTLAGGAVNAFKYGGAVLDLAKTEGMGSAASLVLGDAMEAIPFGPVGLAVAGVAAVIGVGLYFAFKNAEGASEKFAASMQSLIAMSSIIDIQKNFTVAIQQTTAAINQQAAASVAANKADLSAGYTGKDDSGLASQYQQQAANAKEYSNTLNTIISQSNTYGSRMSTLAGIFGSTAGAQNALTLAGVSAGKVATETNSVWATQLTELEALAKGYGYMGSQSGAAGAQLNALNISTGTTTKNIQALVQAESAWISMITGGESSFVAYEQGFSTLSGAIGKSAASAPTVTVTLGKLSDKFTALGATMAGTSASSLAVRQAFDSQLSAGVTLYGNLQTLATASGNTSTQQKELAQSGKDIIAQMLPFAAGSKQATAEVSSLAQLMGGPATDSFQTLAKWVGNTKGAEADLNSEQAKLTISSSNLTTAAKNLGNALDTMVTSDEAAAVAKTANLEGATQGLANAANSARGVVNSTALTLSGEYVTALTKAGIGTTQATQYLNAYLKQLGYTPSEISTIDSQLGDSVEQWNKYDAAITQNINASTAFQKATKGNQSALVAMSNSLPGTITQLGQMWAALVKQDGAMVKSGNDATGAKGQFISFAMQGINLTTQQANALWQKFGNQNLDVLASKATNTKNQFITFAENGLHLTNAQAQALWGEFALQNLDMLATKGNTAKNSFIELAKNGLDLTTSQAQTLWATLKDQYLDTLANKAGETESAFVAVARQFGDTAAQAQKLWQQLHETAGNYDANVVIKVSGGGKVAVQGSVTVTEGVGAVQVTNPGGGTAVNGGVANAGNGQISTSAGTYATGGKVPGWHNGGDNVLAMSPHGAIGLQGGEAIVPKNLATHPAFTGFAKSHGIPGYASGGLLSGSVSGNADPANVSSLVSKYEEPNFAHSTAAQVLSQYGTALKNALNNAVAQAKAAAASGPAGTAIAGAASANLLAIAKYMMQHGATATSAAGIAGDVAGESGGNPESREAGGGGGMGLIQWTGNTVGIPAGQAIITGNATRDLDVQMGGILGYINSRGGMARINAAGTVNGAADVFSLMLAPAQTYSDTRPAVAEEIYAQLAGGKSSGVQSTAAGINGGVSSGGGGTVVANGYSYSKGGRVRPYSGGGAINEPVLGYGLNSGIPYSFAENGQPEYVSNAGQVPAGNPMMQPMTTYQGNTTNQQLSMIVKLLQQMPYAYASAMSQGAGNGVKHGYFGAQS